MKRLLPANIPLHPWEIAEEHCTLRNEVLGQYFLGKIFARKQLGFVISLHPILASKACLNACISLNPSPLTFLGCVNLSHESQQIFLSMSLLSHQNLAKTDWRGLQRLIGSSEQVKAKDGMAESTDCSIMALPAIEKKCVDQLIGICFIMSTI